MEYHGGELDESGFKDKGAKSEKAEKVNQDKSRDAENNETHQKYITGYNMHT